jgi:hypothetical protein
MKATARLGKTEYSIEGSESSNVKITRINADGVTELYIPKSLIQEFAARIVSESPVSVTRRGLSQDNVVRIIGSRIRQIERKPQNLSRGQRKLDKLFEYAKMHGVSMDPWSGQIEELKTQIMLHEVHDT